MPDLTIFQEIYLVGVICAYVIFMVVLAAGAAWSNSARPAPAPRKAAEPAVRQSHAHVHAAE